MKSDFVAYLGLAQICTDFFTLKTYTFVLFVFFFFRVDSLFLTIYLLRAGMLCCIRVIFFLGFYFEQFIIAVSVSNSPKSLIPKREILFGTIFKKRKNSWGFHTCPLLTYKHSTPAVPYIKLLSSPSRGWTCLEELNFTLHANESKVLKNKYLDSVPLPPPPTLHTIYSALSTRSCTSF